MHTKAIQAHKDKIEANSDNGTKKQIVKLSNFKSKIIRCLSLLMETCQRIANVLQIEKICICEWVQNIHWLCIKKARVKSLCHCVSAAGRLLLHLYTYKANEKLTTKTTFAHCAVYHIGICIFVLWKDLFTEELGSDTHTHTTHIFHTHPYRNHRWNLWHMKLTKATEIHLQRYEHALNKQSRVIVSLWIWWSLR